MRYRSDVDGLRAIAIIPVVLFHLGASAFGGGFIGVDVFFVISGYLITGLIYGEMLSGTFSFAYFYERRVRRLFPALLIVMVTTSIIAAILMLPQDFKSFSQSLAATSIFAVNLFFWKTAGYFEGPAEMKPLLHAWSLSVEEQFYITYPIALLLVVRFLPRLAPLAIAGGMLLSFVVSIVWIEIDPDAVFYLPMFRAWELLIGALLAMEVLPQPGSQRLRDALSLAGLGMIGYGVIAFSRETIFPGANAFYPAIGAALVIYAGISGKTLVGRLLALRPLVFVGLISYPLYLWHWPLIVFAKYWLMRELTLLDEVTVAVASVLLATISWHYVERPFRGRRGIWSRPILFKAAGLSIVLVFAVGLVGAIGDGLPQRLPRDVVRLAAAEQADSFRDMPCFNSERGESIAERACRLGAAGSPSFLLWGDSHALMLSSAIDREARERAMTGLFVGKSGCPPLVGIDRYDKEDRGCREFNDRVVTFLEQNQGIRTVILASRWALSSTGNRYGNDKGAAVVISPDGVNDNPRAFREGLERTLRYLNERDLEVVFVAQVPEIGWNVPSMLARGRLFGREIPPPPSLEAYRERQGIVTSALAELSDRYRFQVVDASPLLCPDATCAVMRDGMPLYGDADHLSMHGATIVSRTLASSLLGTP